MFPWYFEHSSAGVFKTWYVTFGCFSSGIPNYLPWRWVPWEHGMLQWAASTMPWNEYAVKDSLYPQRGSSLMGGTAVNSHFVWWVVWQDVSNIMGVFLGMLYSGVCCRGWLLKRWCLGWILEGNRSFWTVRGKDIPGKVTEAWKNIVDSLHHQQCDAIRTKSLYRGVMRLGSLTRAKLKRSQGSC